MSPEDKEVFRRYYEKAPLIHLLAQEYGVDPYTVVFEWTLERFDFNANIRNRFYEWQEREQKRQEMKRGK